MPSMPWRCLSALGWAEWGGTGWDIARKYIFDEECGYASAPQIVSFGVGMCAPVLLKFGTEAQKQRFLPRIYRGDDFWVQGYSEPSAGSDLAGLKTRHRLRQHTMVGQGFGDPLIEQTQAGSLGDNCDCNWTIWSRSSKRRFFMRRKLSSSR